MNTTVAWVLISTTFVWFNRPTGTSMLTSCLSNGSRGTDVSIEKSQLDFDLLGSPDIPVSKGQDQARRVEGT